MKTATFLLQVVLAALAGAFLGFVFLGCAHSQPSCDFGPAPVVHKIRLLKEPAEGKLEMPDGTSVDAVGLIAEKKSLEDFMGDVTALQKWSVGVEGCRK